MLDNVRRVRRSAKVGRTAARVYFGYRRTQRRARKLSPEASAAAWARAHDTQAERIFATAVSLKGLYIKMGQFVGTRSDVFPAAYARTLGRLQDQAPPRTAASVKATIEKELGRPVSALFREFDETPLASASLAQVHRATLADGREVAVKVQHPEVADLVRLDIRNLNTIVGIVARRQPNFDYRAIVRELGNQVPLELDFVREAEMTRRIKANLASSPGIVVPGVIDELVSRKVLVLEYLEGTRLFRPGGKPAASLDGARVARAITEAFGQQILMDGVFQADPHPGNLLLLPDGRIGLLDFGLTKELPEAMRLGFARLVVASGQRNPAGVVSAFKELGLKTRNDGPEDVMALTQIFFGPRGAGATSPFGSGTRQALARNPVEALPGDLILLGRVVGLLRGVCSTLGAPLTPMQMLRPFAERALAAEDSGAAAAAGS